MRLQREPFISIRNSTIGCNIKKAMIHNLVENKQCIQFVACDYGVQMKWREARELFPNQFLLVSILDYHYEGDKKVVDEVAPIRPINDEDANN